MPLPDGRIRSRDLDTESVNSRVIDDLRSSNYDGSLTNPETDPGTEGWQLLKNGILTASQAIIRGTIEAAEIIAAVVRGGQIDVVEGGKINIAGGGSLQVGDLVTLDENGLTVIGGFVTPVWPFTADDSWGNVTISSGTQVASATIDPPDWVETLHLMSIANATFVNEASALRLFTLQVVNDDGGASEDAVGRNHEAADGSGTGVGTVAFAVSNRETIPLSPTGRSVTVTVNASVSVGSQSTNGGSLSIIGFGVRNS